jgi:hypothetical protein
LFGTLFSTKEKLNKSYEEEEPNMQNTEAAMIQ